jgi:hypothetical protein
VGDIRLWALTWGNRGPKTFYAAEEYLAAFDAVLAHYGWQASTARAAFDAAIWFDSRGGYALPPGERADAVMAPPPPIGEERLTALERATKQLWLSVAEETGQQLDREALRTMATGGLGLTTQVIACAILKKHPDWTDQQIADAVPCHRGSLYRFERYMKMRQDNAREGMDLKPRGSLDSREDSGGNKHRRLEAFTNDADDEGGEPLEGSDD